MAGSRRSDARRRGDDCGLWRATGQEADGERRSVRVRLLARPTAGAGAGRELAVEDLERAIAEGEVVWVDLVHPEAAAAALLGDLLGLGPVTVEDCLLPLRMPKLDPLPGGGAFVAVFALRLEEGDEPRLRAISVPLVVGLTYLVTVRRDPVPEVGARLETAFAREADPPAPAGAALAHAVLDALVDRHLPIMLRTAEVAEELEERLDPRSEQEGLAALERLIVLRRDLLAFRRLGVAQQEVLRRLGRGFPGVRADLSDVADNQREAVDTAAATCDYIDGAIEAFRVRRDARTEAGIRRLTVLAGVLGPVSILIGLWSLNFPNIPGTRSSWGWSIFVGLQVLLILLGAWHFRRRGLL